MKEWFVFSRHDCIYVKWLITWFYNKGTQSGILTKIQDLTLVCILSVFVCLFARYSYILHRITQLRGSSLACMNFASTLINLQGTNGFLHRYVFIHFQGTSVFCVFVHNDFSTKKKEKIGRDMWRDKNVANNY